MNNDEIEKLRKNLANESHIMSTPLDIEQLVKDGLLKKIGKSYYVDNMSLLPEHVSKKIKTHSPTKNGIKVTFYKETKSMKKMADKLKQFRDKK